VPRDPRQMDLMSAAPSKAPIVEVPAGVDAPAPRYRPRAPVQQLLDLDPGAFRLR
jgi:hypothetical protein